jgi:hypothetical protein
MPTSILGEKVGTGTRFRYSDNDSRSTNELELDIDWQAVTLYNLYFARWWAAGAPATRPVFDRR